MLRIRLREPAGTHIGRVNYFYYPKELHRVISIILRSSTVSITSILLLYPKFDQYLRRAAERNPPRAHTLALWRRKKGIEWKGRGDRVMYRNNSD